MSEDDEKFRTAAIKDAKQVIGLKSMAYKDYLAARKLLNTGMLHQAAFLINTCIEKELKSYLFARNINFNSTHEIQKLLGIISNLPDADWTKKINSEFIKVVSKIYKSRYFEILGPGYNFVINKNKFLAEFDYTYAELEKTTMLRYEQNSKIKSPYNLDKEKNNAHLYENNYILNSLSKIDFLNQEDTVYEFRISETHHAVEVYYTILKNHDLKTFNYEGLKQDGQSFNLSQWVRSEL
jgi:HEPN domain-containing protein